MTSLEGTTISRIFIIGLHHRTKSKLVKLPLTGRERRAIAKSLESITINPHNNTQENSNVSSVSNEVADPKNPIATKPHQVTTINSLSRRTTIKLKRNHVNHVSLVNPVSFQSLEMNQKSYLTLEREAHPSLKEDLSKLEAVTEVTPVETLVVV